MDNEITNQTISFDLHDTLLIFPLGGKLSKNKKIRDIFYYLGNFKLFIFIYTYFCKRNENIIKEMELLNENNNVIILTSTNKKSEKIIRHFLNKNKIYSYRNIIFREKMESEHEYKIRKVIENNIILHYDDSEIVCDEINKIPNKKAILIKK